MVSWSQPEGQASFIESLDTSSTMTDVLEVISESLQVVRVVANIVDELAAAEDPLTAISFLTVQQIQQFLADLLEADLYVYPIMPVTWGALMRPYPIETALNDVAISLTDSRDGNRPLLGPDSAYASLTVVVGANNWADFAAVLDTFGQLFDGTQLNKWRRLADIVYKRNEMAKVPFPRAERNSQGVPWDWSRTDWMHLIPQLSGVLDEVINALNAFTGVSRGIADMIDQLIDMIDEQIEYIGQLAARIQEVVDLINKWKELIPRMYYLYAGNTIGGVSGYVQTLNNAGNKPQFKLTAGITILATGPNPDNYIKNVGRLIGLRIEEAEAAVARAQAAADRVGEDQ